MYINFIEFDISSIDRTIIIMILAGQIVVIAILFILYKLYIVSIPSLLRFFRKKKMENEISPIEKSEKSKVSGDVHAAIAMALYLHFNEMHDDESNVITIQRVSKTYSPWSSKIYNMRNFR